MNFKCIDDLPMIPEFDDCNPQFQFGEIDEIIVSHLYREDEQENEITPYPTDVSSAAEWELLLEPDAVTGEATAYRIPVRGTLSEPDQTVLDASKNRKAYPPAEWSIESRVDDLSDVVYEALRQLRNKQVRIWFIAGGNIFGGTQGIVPASINAYPVIEEGFDTMHNFHLNATWKSDEIPERAPAPEFDPEDTTE